MSIKKSILGAGLIAVAALTGVAYAAGGKSDYKMEHVHWHFNGPFGTYDRAAMQRGFQVYREVCAACHSLKFVSFRHLGDKGGPYYDKKYPNPNENPYVKNFAAEYDIRTVDGETGDEIDFDTRSFLTRPGIPADKFPPVFANDAAAAASNGGAIPPELSAMVKARTGGADYVYNLLTAYGLKPPKDLAISEGSHYNPVMEGGVIAMAAPLSDGQVVYEDVEYTDKDGNKQIIKAPEATVEQMSKDVTEFLAWTADPKMEQRKGAGAAVMLYLLILTILTFLSYKTVWRNVKH